MLGAQEYLSQKGKKKNSMKLRLMMIKQGASKIGKGDTAKIHESICIYTRILIIKVIGRGWGSVKSMHKRKLHTCMERKLTSD